MKPLPIKLLMLYLVDLCPDEEEHEDKHKEITKELQKYLLDIPLISMWREKLNK